MVEPVRNFNAPNISQIKTNIKRGGSNPRARRNAVASSFINSESEGKIIK